jgi:hypothetical protein
MDVVTLPLIIGEVIAFGMIIGGILLFPTSRRLGRYLEVLIEEKRAKGVGMADEVKRLERELRETQAEVARLSERQARTESRLEQGAEPPLLPRG